MEFELRAEKNCLKVIRKSLVTSGSVNVYQVKITFSTDWNGLDRRVVFWAVGNGTKVTVEPDADGVCTIPWEVLTEPGKLLYVGVYGTSGAEIVLPTIWAVLGQIIRGAAPDEGSGPPTPDAWQQLKDDLKEATEKLEDIEGYTTAAGESAERASGAAGAAGGYAQNASDAAAEARRQAGLAGASAGAAEQSAKDADAARQEAEKAAGNAAGKVTEQLAGYVKDAEAAKNGAEAAQQGAEKARTETGEYRDAAKKSASEALKNANTAKQYSGKPPIIQGGTWWTWAAEKQAYVDTGDPANLNPRGEYDPEAVYDRMDVVRRSGSSYLALRDGLTGVLPIDGEDWMCLVERSGKSAYEQAVDGGLVATEEEFKSALADIVDIYGDWKAGLTEDELCNPDIVYERSRPIDWMKMPELEDVQDGEFWLLFQWLPGDTAECSFTMRSNSDIKVEAGRYEAGVFTPDEKYTKDYHPASATANVTVPISLDGADFGDLTSTGRVQAMVRISGELTLANAATDYARYVDGIISARDLVQLNLNRTGCLVYFAVKNMSSLNPIIKFGGNSRLLAVRGSADGFNAMTDWRNVFGACTALCAIPAGVTFDAMNITGDGTRGGAFSDCVSLRRLPPYAAMSNLVYGHNLFQSCTSLQELPAGMTLEHVQDGSGMFTGCNSLRELPGSVTFASLTNGSGMMHNCYALRELPPGVTFKYVTNGQGMFQSCFTLRELPPGVTFDNLSNGAQLLRNCTSLRELPNANFPEAVNLQELVYSCTTLLRVTNLYIPKCSNLTNAFGSCTMLEELTFDPRMETWETPQDIVLTNTRLSHAAIVRLFESLPAIETPKTVTLTNTPGASQVTAEDVAIATAKGWKVAGTAVATASAPIGDGPDIFDDVDTDRQPYFVDEDGKRYYGPFYQS